MFVVVIKLNYNIKVWRNDGGIIVASEIGKRKKKFEPVDIWIGSVDSDRVKIYRINIGAERKATRICKGKNCRWIF